MKGLDIFRQHFDGLSHHYVLIGGAACEIVMEEVGLDFRATKDLDLIILVEALDAAFGARFWAFVEAPEPLWGSASRWRGAALLG